MRKIYSIMLACLVAACGSQASAQNGQRRLSGSEAAPEVSRSVANDDDRSASAALRVRPLRTPSADMTSVFNAIPPKAVRDARMAPKALVGVASSLNVFGTVIYNDTWTSSNSPYGVYHIPVADGSVTDCIFTVNKNPLYSFFDGDHTVYTMYELAYGSYVMGYDLYKYDTITKTNVGIIEFDDLPIKATDVAFDTTTGRPYAMFSGDYYGETYRFWGYIDLEKRNVVSVSNFDFSLRGVAIDKFGQAYGVGLDKVLYKINKETGETEVVGATGCPDLYYVSSAAYNDKDNNILLTYSNQDGGGMVAIDPVTAQSTVVSVFAEGDEVIGLYVPFQAPDKAPAEPTFSATCADGSMTVDFTIVMPTTLFDGTDASGETMGYKVYADGTEILSGESVAGTTVNLSKTMTVSGNTNFVAVASNAVGESNQAKASCYVGKGTPAATSGVVLAYADGILTLTWDAVTASSDGGFVAPNEIRYDIVDAEGNTIASDIEGTTWTKAQDVPDEIIGFSFGVVAKYDGKTSKAVMSNSVYLGHYNAPANIDLLKKDFFGQHSVIDANADGKTWIFNASKGAEYKYSDTNNGDDWLISPAFYLEAGNAYDFEAIARAYSNGYPEKIEICMGSAPTVEAMTTTLVETTTVLGDDSSLTASIVPAESGEYYLGFHAVSDAYQWSLYLKGYNISSPYGATAPDAVTDLKLIPDATGALNVEISFTAPVKSVTGADYTDNMNFRVLRNGEEVKTLTGAPGTTLSFKDNVAEKGTYDYTVVSSNLAGDEGRSTSASVFIGPNVPNVPVDVKAVENPQNLGEVTLSWSDPATDIAGNPLLAANLTYNVYLYDSTADDWTKLNSEPLSQRTYTFRAQDADAPQAFMQVLVETLNCGVPSDGQAGPGLVAVGPGYTLPVTMTCLDDAKKYIIGLNNWDGCEFGMKTDGEMSSVTSQDGDGQFYYGERVGSSASLGMGKGIGDFIFGKVDLTGAKNPVFSLYTWKITETDKTRLEIIAVCEGVSEVVSTITYDNDTHNLWTRKIVDLSAYKDKSIQLIIRYYSDGLVYCFFDNMKFMDMPDYDLNAVSVEAPKTAIGGEPFEVKATVENVGRLDAQSFSVELLANGEVVDTKTVEGLPVNATAVVTFNQTITMAQKKVIEYTARIVYSSDLDASNNLTPNPAVVTREDSELPVVTNLTGKFTDGGNLIEWDAINADDLPYDPTVESFENAEPFAKAYPDWTFVDRDGKPCGGTGDISIPNHEYGVDPESFIVIDGTYSGFANSYFAKEYAAADGNKYLGSLWTMGEQPNTLAESDDWAISPTLKGCAQTITFCAKNASINYSEFLQVWYSTVDSTNPDDFEMVTEFNNPGYNYRVIRTDGWGNFSVNLPEGAVRVAFHVVSNDGMMLMLDKVSYLAADATVGLEHTGYNVYCDGVKLNDAPITENQYVHANNDSDHTYHVTAVYNRGESEATGPLFIATSAINGIFAQNLAITVEGHDIVITGATDSEIRIFAADGKTVFFAEGDSRVTVAPGIYLVTVDGKATKVVVR